MDTFYVPIEGLTVTDDWNVGPVVVIPTDRAMVELDDLDLPGDPSGFRSAVEAQRAGAIAKVHATDHDRAIDLVAGAVDVLRVFQHVRHFTTQLTQFGIEGDIGRGVVPYAVSQGERSGVGYKRRGDALGWTFSEPSEWTQADAFHWVANAIGSDVVSEAERRALVAVQLLSDAIVEQRGTFKMVALVTALEALVLERNGSSQTFQLARKIAYFGCGGHSGDLCGRTRVTCPYLELDPANRQELKTLKRLRTKGALPPWRCSEWHRVVDWYDLRSDVVHGAGPEVSYRDASQALHWVLRYLTEPILNWLRDHPTDPELELAAAIRALPKAPDWEARLGERP